MDKLIFNKYANVCDLFSQFSSQQSTTYVKRPVGHPEISERIDFTDWGPW